MRKVVRFLLLAAVLAALGLLPFRATDAAKLIPVRAVIVTRDGGSYTVDVGQAVRGVGRTLSEALEDLRAGVSGEIFFPTAEEIVVTDTGDDFAGTVTAVTEESAFQPAAGLYRTEEHGLDASAVAAYLAAHPSEVTLVRVRGALHAGEPVALPTLRVEGGGFAVDAP